MLEMMLCGIWVLKVTLISSPEATLETELGENAMPSVMTMCVTARVWPARTARTEAMESVECMVAMVQATRSNE